MLSNYEIIYIKNLIEKYISSNQYSDDNMIKCLKQLYLNLSNCIFYKEYNSLLLSPSNIYSIKFITSYYIKKLNTYSSVNTVNYTNLNTSSFLEILTLKEILNKFS